MRPCAPAHSSWLALCTLAACTIAAIGFTFAFTTRVHAQQGTATIVGTVKDAVTREPLRDAIVTLTSPSLQGENYAVTDASGGYRVAGLPPGTYVLTLEKDSFETHTNVGIPLRADNTARFNALMTPSKTKAEQIIVVARPPVIDVDSSQTGLNVSSAFTERIPLTEPGSRGSASRSFDTVAVAVPGAQFDTYGVSINGTSSPENQYLIDGLSVNNPAFGVLGTPLSLEFMKEVSVITGGYMPEYGRSSGGILNAITKSGSNEFHGSAFVNIAPGFMEGERETVRRIGQTIVTELELSYIGDIGADVGGPIVRDKLWFYVGFDWARTRYRLGRSLYRTLYDDDDQPIPDGNGGTRTRFVPGTDQDFFAEQDALQAIGKLTWAANNQNRFTLSAYATPTFTGGDGEYGINPVSGQPEIGTGNNFLAGPLNGTYDALAHRFQGSSANVQARWISELDGKRAGLDTMLGWHHESGGRLPSDGSDVGDVGRNSGLAGISNVWWTRTTPPHSITEFESVPNGGCDAPADNPDLVPCPVTDYHSGGPEQIDDQAMNVYQGRSVLTYTLEAAGHHVMKAGFEVGVATYDHERAYTGGRDYAENYDGAFFLDGRQYGYLVGPDDPVVLDSLDNMTTSLIAGGFVQESWSIVDQVTLNVGLRYDTQLLYAADGALAMALPNQWSPRVGAVYDPTYEGRSKIYGNFARYYETVPLDVVDRTGSGEPLLVGGHDPATCNPLDVSQQHDECLRPDNYLSGFGGPPNDKFSVFGAGKTPVDPDIKAPSNDELVFGGEYEIIKDGRLGVSYTKRWLNRTIEDMSRDEASTYFLGNPGYGVANDFPKAVRRYDAVTAYFQKVYSDLWLAQVSYTVSYLRGNYSGLFRNEDKQLDPNQNSDFDLKSLTVNRFGVLPGDHTHAIKAFGARDFMVKDSGRFTVGGAIRAYSGEPSNYLGAHPLYQNDQVYILPRGAGDRLPWTFTTDLRLAYGFKLGAAQVLTLSADVFNLFNFQAETGRDERYTVAPVAPVTSGGISNLKYADGTPFDKQDANPNFGRAVEYQPPRIFRFGLRMTY